MPIALIELAFQTNDYERSLLVNKPVMFAQALADVAINFSQGKCGAAQSPSCQPTADQVAIFDHDNYAGSCVVLGVGDYPNVATTGFGNDILSSIKVGANVQVTLFESDSYRGASETLTSDDPSLAGNTIKNDSSTSLKVAAKTQVIDSPWVDGRYYTIFSANSNLALDVYGGQAVNDAKIVQWESHGGKPNVESGGWP